MDASDMLGCRQHGPREKFFILVSKFTPQLWISCLQRRKTTRLKINTNAKVWKFHLRRHQDTNIHSIPVAFSDAVEDGRFVFRPQTVGSCVAEKQPVSYTELRQQTSLHHLIQIISRRTPQTAGEQWLFCAQLLRKQHITHDHWEYVSFIKITGLWLGQWQRRLYKYIKNMFMHWVNATFFRRNWKIFTLCAEGVDIESSHSSLLANDP